MLARRQSEKAKKYIKMVGEAEAKRKSFFVVFIPADSSKELEEWEIALPDDKEEQLGCLTTRLRQHFKQTSSSSATKSANEQEEIFKQQILNQLPKGANMTPDMLSMMLQVCVFFLLLFLFLLISSPSLLQMLN